MGALEASGAGASRGLQGSPGASGPLTRRFAAARGQDPSKGGPWKEAANLACQVEALFFGFRVFPSRGKSMYIVYIWPTGVAGGRAVPPDVREEPGGALYVHSP